jgi:hypothetical protein
LVAVGQDKSEVSPGHEAARANRVTTDSPRQAVLEALRPCRGSRSAGIACRETRDVGEGAQRAVFARRLARSSRVLAEGAVTQHKQTQQSVQATKRAEANKVHRAPTHHARQKAAPVSSK